MAASPAEPVPSSRRLSLAARLFLLVLVLLSLAIGGAVGVSFRQGETIAGRAVDRALAASAEVQAESAAQRLEEVELKVQLLAADASFVNYIADSQGGVPGGSDPALTESASIYDLLRERQEAFGFDLGIVLDPLGNVLARTDQPESFDESLADDAFATTAIEQLTPISGYWRREGKVYQAAIWPLDKGRDLVGFLVIARSLDDGVARRLRRLSNADVAILLPTPERILITGSSLADTDRSALQAWLDADSGGLASAVRAGGMLDRVALQLGPSRYAARLVALDAEGGAEVGSALQLTSLDEAESGYRAILNTVGMAGLAALVLALPLCLLLARATLQPLRDMAKVAKEAAAGRYQHRIGLGGSDELAELSNAFDSLLADLRGERDIESYVTHLSRLLPEPGDETSAGAGPVTGEGRPAQKSAMLLLAVDLRQRLLPGSGQSSTALLALAADYVGGIEATAQEHGGERLLVAGSRMLLGFAGESRLPAALGCLRTLIEADSELAAALLDGEVVHGSLPERSELVALGPAVQQVERLLADAPAGWALLPKSLGDTLKATHGDGAVKVGKGQLSGKAFYCLDGEALQRLPLRAPAAAAAPAAADASGMLATRVSGAPILSASKDLAPGTRLGGRFRIVAVLGSGGMGVVYKARDLELDDVVALKMLKGDALRDREQLERLKSEIKLARRITHPNVLRTFDFGEIDGLPFISMEYVRGMTLRYLLKQADRVPYTAALRIARQLCAGLQAAHEVGVLHRDIKPENLILEASGNAKLMDFGIARPIRRDAPGTTEAGFYLGTPAYSAPEQLAGQDVDHRADIFASGALMCEMFSGQLPFEGASTVELYMAQMHGEPRRPRELGASIPEALEAIILRCLARRREDRFQSAAELGAALDALRT